VSEQATHGVLYFVLILYFLPSVIALLRRRQAASVIVLNLFLGWSLIGWVVALVWAVSSKPQQVVVLREPAK
jgi:hypothetical protein